MPAACLRTGNSESCRLEKSEVDMSVTHTCEASAGMEKNLKKAVTEMLALTLLHDRPMYIGELSEEICARSGGRLKVASAYSAVMRLEKAGYVRAFIRYRAPGQRRREFYEPTQTAPAYLDALLTCYRSFSDGMDDILKSCLYHSP